MKVSFPTSARKQVNGQEARLALISCWPLNSRDILAARRVLPLNPAEGRLPLQLLVEKAGDLVHRRCTLFAVCCASSNWSMWKRWLLCLHSQLVLAKSQMRQASDAFCARKELGHLRELLVKHVLNLPIHGIGNDLRQDVLAPLLKYEGHPVVVVIAFACSNRIQPSMRSGISSRPLF